MFGDLDQSWQRIEPRHLAGLDGIARTGSFRGAAEVLGYSVSTLSEQVKSLERLVGQTLVERPGGRRSVSVTAAGRRLLDHAADIVASYVAARADLEAIKQRRPTVRVGVFQSVAVALLPGILNRLVESQADLKVELVERPNDADLLELVAAGDLEAAFTALPATSGPFTVTELLTEPYLLLARAGDPLSQLTSVPVSALQGINLVDYRDLRAVHHGRRRLPKGTRPVVVARSDDNSIIHALVAAGIGVAILPYLSIDRFDPRVSPVPVEPPLQPRVIALVTHRDRSPHGVHDLLDATLGEVASVRESVRVLDT